MKMLVVVENVLERLGDDWNISIRYSDCVKKNIDFKVWLILENILNRFNLLSID